MRKYTSSLFILLVFTCAMLLPRISYATHAAGGELVYSWVSGSTYHFTFKFYRACGPGTTSAAPTSQTMCYQNSCGSTTYSVVLQPTQTAVPVSTGCPGYPNWCNGGSLPGYLEYWYEGNVTLPIQCNKWRFFVYIGSRNNTVGNLNNPGGQNFYVEATLDNLNAQGNSSAVFTVKPVPYCCINNPYSFNNGVVDPNNDSLTFEMMNPIGGTQACTQVPPNTPSILLPAYNLTNNPFPTGNTFSLSPSTGQQTFTPNTQGQFVITMLVREWRNGLNISTVMRDIQVVVIVCNNPQPAVNTVQSSLVGAQIVNGRVEGCAGSNVSFCVDMKSPSPTAVLIATDNHAASIPASTVTYTGQATDSIRACFSWNPGLLDTGLKNLSFIVKDSTCLPPGVAIIQVFNIPIYIWPITQIFNDTTICPGDTVHLNAIGGSSFTWTVLPGGSPLTTLSCTNCKNPSAWPGTTTNYVVTSNNLSFCNKNKDTVTITVPTPPIINAGPDITTCINNSVPLNINLPPAPGTNYHIQWTPGTYLSSDTIANPICSPTSDVTYIIKVVPNGLNNCSASDTLNITVLQGFKIFNHDTAICDGATVAVNATGDMRYTFAWVPTTGVSNPVIMNPQIIPVGTQHYVVTATFPGCRDSTQEFTIEVQPNPIVYVGADQTICYGDTIHFDNATVTPAYPNYTYNWSPAGAFNDNTLLHPIFTALNSASVKLTVTTPAGCSGSDDMQVTVVPSKFMSVTPSDTAICPGDSVHLHITGTQIYQIWKPNYYISDTLSTDPYVYPIASTKYVVSGRDLEYCLDTEVVNITVNPAAVLSLTDTTTIFPGESYQMNPRGNCFYFSWAPPIGLSNPNISNPIAKPDVNTRYFLNAKTETGCRAIDSIDVFVSPETYLDMPNAFTPGSDPNATLKVSRRGIATLNSFRVFDRWGQKVFETKNIDEGWDGRINGHAQPMGVYVYTIDAVTPTGKRFIKQGNVTLIR